MIITAQLFFNELDLLEISCHALRDVVDAHVIIEARTTFTGLPKPLYFSENQERFRDFNIIHRVVDLDPRAASAWHREGESHRHLLALVRDVAPEIVIWSDADEIARPDTVERFKAIGGECVTLNFEHLIYYFDRTRPDVRDLNPKIAYFDPKRQHQPWRGETHWPVMNDAGWHFEYMGPQDHLLAKLSAISHAPEEGCANMRAAVALGDRPGLELTVPYPLEQLPAYVVQNRQRFARNFSPS